MAFNQKVLWYRHRVFAVFMDFVAIKRAIEFDKRSWTTSIKFDGAKRRSAIFVTKWSGVKKKNWVDRKKLNVSRKSSELFCHQHLVIKFSALDIIKIFMLLRKIAKMNEKQKRWRSLLRLLFHYSKSSRTINEFIHQRTVEILWRLDINATKTILQFFELMFVWQIHFLCFMFEPHRLSTNWINNKIVWTLQ